MSSHPQMSGQTDQHSAWPTQVAAKLETLTALVEDKAVRPLVSIARIAVFGTLAAILMAMIAVTGSVALVRLLNVYVFTGQDWASILLLGGILSLSGLFLWSKRTVRRDS